MFFYQVVINQLVINSEILKKIPGIIFITTHRLWQKAHGMQAKSSIKKKVDHAPVWSVGRVLISLSVAASL